VVLAEIERQQELGKEVVFRADAAFAKPEIYAITPLWGRDRKRCELLSLFSFVWNWRRNISRSVASSWEVARTIVTLIPLPSGVRAM
jgi:hypothetical protein